MRVVKYYDFPNMIIMTDRKSFACFFFRICLLAKIVSVKKFKKTCFLRVNAKKNYFTRLNPVEFFGIILIFFDSLNLT